MTSVTFCRRLPSFKFLGLNCLSSKGIQYYGNLKHVRTYSRHLFKKTISPVSQCQFHDYNIINDFVTSKRSKQTSSDSKMNTEDTSKSPEEPAEPAEKLSLFKKYKKMLKEYWYVLLPVHSVTSVFWFGGFYYAAKSGIDIVPFLEFINLPETFIEPLRNSSLGYIAVASAFYKLATPARYMVTLGGTTVAVKILTRRGLIKPAPTKEQIKTIIQNKLKKEASDDKS